MLYAVYVEYGLYAHVQYIQHVQHIQGGFLRRIVVYLRTAVPTKDSSLFIVILRIQLELICWATTPLIIIILLTILYLYT